MNHTLKNKRALITGGSRGIGAAIVKRLASEGADVAFTYTSSPDRANEIVQAAQALGVRALAIQADSAEASAVVAAVEDTVNKLGGIDILVNNAGVLAIGAIDDFKLADFDRTFAVNVRAVFVATQAAVKHMKGGGRIINIGSTNAERMPFAGGGIYAMSKSALQGLVQGLSRDLGPRGITINNVQPGPIATEMNPSEGEFAEMLKKHIAVVRYGTVEEVAGLVAYLAGPESGYITGANLMIDGGFSA
ncbi:SDR family oxidoreductase [Nostoc sp. C052]|uniref:SDR family oxidoreductase n=1 Tax=Nostoc sp. C052 TaxID=2576902 RepID=UPI0015C3026E|nr:SDR family oxidoreductase [Nostoc sp. C052]QLE44362.1 SDR family oxidoreductase [Nostoc sp. C052]